MTKILYPITVYHSHSTKVLATSMTLSIFLRMSTTIFRYIRIWDFFFATKNQQNSWFGILLVCETVMAPNDPPKVCLKSYAQADVLYDYSPKYPSVWIDWYWIQSHFTSEFGMLKMNCITKWIHQWLKHVMSFLLTAKWPLLH